MYVVPVSYNGNSDPVVAYDMYVATYCFDSIRTPLQLTTGMSCLSVLIGTGIPLLLTTGMSLPID